jgi:hypothetical protein
VSESARIHSTWRGALDDPADPLSIAGDGKGKLGKGRDKLAKILAKSCDAPGVSMTALPGSCDAMAGAALSSCLVDRAECRFCQMVNAADDTFADCDGFDDATANGSCENLSCPDGENACSSGCTDLDTDEANCGSCGTTCGMGETCTSGLCL